MAGYFGTDLQQRLQAQAEASAAFVRSTPGACQAGRMMGCDDPDALGWTYIDSFLTRDEVCGFRLLDANRVEALRAELVERGCRFDTWDVFLADRQTALAASDAILSRGLPDGLIDLDMPSEPEGGYTNQIQVSMSRAGLVPFSGSMLTGAVGPATTAAIGDGRGKLFATAHGYMPHNQFSPFARYGWGGLVAVDEAMRGKGLGSYVNARMIANVFRKLDATHVYELVSSTNIPSRRMVEACGLTREPALICGIATPNESARFTR